MSYSVIKYIDAGRYIALVELLGLLLREYTTADYMFQCQMSVSPPRGNFDFKFACLGSICFSRPSALGPICQLSAPRFPRPHKICKCWF